MDVAFAGLVEDAGWLSLLVRPKYCNHVRCCGALMPVLDCEASIMAVCKLSLVSQILANGHFKRFMNIMNPACRTVEGGPYIE